MARIAGVDIPKQKRGVISLTYIYGIGRSRAKEILATAKVDESTKVQDWTDDEIGAIRDVIGNIKIEGELRSETQLNIKRLMDIGCYRGIRHRAGLPLRGQRNLTLKQGTTKSSETKRNYPSDPYTNNQTNNNQKNTPMTTNTPRNKEKQTK